MTWMLIAIGVTWATVVAFGLILMRMAARADRDWADAREALTVLAAEVTKTGDLHREMVTNAKAKFDEIKRQQDEALKAQAERVRDVSEHIRYDEFGIPIGIRAAEEPAGQSPGDGARRA